MTKKEQVADIQKHAVKAGLSVTEEGAEAMVASIEEHTARPGRTDYPNDIKRCELCGRVWNRCKGHGRAS